MTETLDRVDSLVRCLIETLSNISHGPSILSDARRETYKNTEFRWQINVASFLLDFKKWLMDVINLLSVNLIEITCHSDGCTVSFVEGVVAGRHFPHDWWHPVSSTASILSHNNSSVEISVNDFFIMVTKAVFYQLQTRIYTKELRDIVNGKKQTTLKDPWRSEVPWPSLHLSKNLLSLLIEEPWVPPDLLKVAATEALFYYHVHKW